MKADNRLIGETPAQTAASHRSKKQQAAATKAATDAAGKAAADAARIAATDNIVFSIPSFPDKEITLGPVRHKLAEPLFRGVGGGDTVMEGVGRALASEGLSTGERVAVWEGVAATGEIAKFRCKSSPLLYVSLGLCCSFRSGTTDLPRSAPPILDGNPIRYPTSQSPPFVHT